MGQHSDKYSTFSLVWDSIALMSLYSYLYRILMLLLSALLYNMNLKAGIVEVAHC